MRQKPLLETTSNSSETGASDVDPYLKKRPKKYRSIVLPPNWFKVGQNKIRRQDYKTHGVISFQELSKVVADRWRILDDETKLFCEMVYSAELKVYRKDLAEYTEKYGTDALKAHKRTYKKKRDRGGDTTSTENGTSTTSSRLWNTLTNSTFSQSTKPPMIGLNSQENNMSPFALASRMRKNNQISLRSNWQTMIPAHNRDTGIHSFGISQLNQFSNQTTYPCTYTQGGSGNLYLPDSFTPFFSGGERCQSVGGLTITSDMSVPMYMRADENKLLDTSYTMSIKTPSVTTWNDNDDSHFGQTLSQHSTVQESDQSGHTFMTALKQLPVMSRYNEVSKRRGSSFELGPSANTTKASLQVTGNHYTQQLRNLAPLRLARASTANFHPLPYTDDYITGFPFGNFEKQEECTQCSYNKVTHQRLYTAMTNPQQLTPTDNDKSR